MHASVVHIVFLTLHVACMHCLWNPCWPSSHRHQLSECKQKMVKVHAWCKKG